MDEKKQMFATFSNEDGFSVEKHLKSNSLYDKSL